MTIDASAVRPGWERTLIRYCDGPLAGMESMVEIPEEPAAFVDVWISQPVAVAMTEGPAVTKSAHGNPPGMIILIYRWAHPGGAHFTGRIRWEDSEPGDCVVSAEIET